MRRCCAFRAALAAAGLIVSGAAVAATAPPDPALDAAIRKVASGGDSTDFRVSALWWTDNEARRIRIWGDGTVVCDERSQARLSPRELRSALRAFADAKFGTLVEEPLEREREREIHRPDDEERLIGRVRISLSGHTREVLQVSNDRESKALERLARTLLDLCGGGPAVQATGVEDGLRKVADGKLAPQSLSIAVQRLADSAGTGEGWILRVTGRTAVVRTRSRDGYGAPKALELSTADFRRLAKTLAEAKVEAFPMTLYASGYTDFSVTVLDRGKSLQARKFAGFTPETHGERQKNFDTIFGAIDRLAARVRAEGKTVPPEDEDPGN